MRKELMDQMVAMLRATSQPYEFVRGKKHYKIILAGKMIAVGSWGRSTQRDHRQLKSAINRRIRELECKNSSPVAPSPGLSGTSTGSSMQTHRGAT